MKCSVCGHDLLMQPDNDEAVCENCGLRYPLETLKSMSAQPTREDPKDSAQVSSVATTTAPNIPIAKEDGEAESNALLLNWKTSVGASVAGAICASALNAIPYDGVIGSFVTIIYFGFGLIYAAFMYPSLFKKRPFSISSGVVSFMNFLAGGFVFGPLWNHNLTIRKRGISHIVYLVGSLTILIALLSFLLMLATSQPETESPQLQVQSSSSTSQPSETYGPSHETSSASAKEPASDNESAASHESEDKTEPAAEEDISSPLDNLSNGSFSARSPIDGKMTSTTEGRRKIGWHSYNREDGTRYSSYEEVKDIARNALVTVGLSSSEAERVLDTACDAMLNDEGRLGNYGSEENGVRFRKGSCTFMLDGEEWVFTIGNSKRTNDEPQYDGVITDYDLGIKLVEE